MPLKRFLLLLAPLLLSISGTIALGQQAPTSGPILRGKVRYSDTNNPVRRAYVNLVGIGDSADQPTVSTNRKGEFIFGNIPAGHYLAVVEAPDLVSPTLFSSPEFIWDDWLWGDIAFGCAEVTVTATTAPPVTIVAQRAGAITGRVTDSEGAPVPDAGISVFVVADDKITPEQLKAWFRLTSDDRGIYRIPGLPTGKYVVRVNDSNVDLASPSDQNIYLNGGFLAAYYPDAASVAEATPVEVVAGRDTQGIDVRLPERKTHKVTGTFVLGKTSLPLSGVSFTLTRDGDPSAIAPSAPGAGWVYREDGSWFANDLPDGRYTIAVDTLGNTQENRPNRGQRSVNILPLKTEFVVEGADISDLTVRLDEAAMLTGKVAYAGTKGERPHLSIEAIPAGLVESGVDSSDDKWNSTMVPIDDDGQFKFTQLAEGRYYLRLEGEGAFAFELARITQDGADLSRKPIGVRVGVNTKVSVTIAAAATTVRLSAAADGNAPGPIGDLLFILRPVETSEWRAMKGPLVYRGDKNGRTNAQLRPGEYIATAVRRRPGHPPDIADDFWDGDTVRRLHFRVVAAERTRDVKVPLEPERLK